ncbi:MAG: multidrug efflux transporter transcriptional repressor AcrR [Pseudomonadota bacterium]
MARKTKQQALETRQQILDAAIHCFSTRGVSSTSLSDIAIRAGVTRGAIYWHFKNKIDILNEIWLQSDECLDKLELEYQNKYPDDPMAQIRALLITLLQSTVRDSSRRALMEIIFHKCEFVGEMETFQKIQQDMLLECYPKIENTLKKCITAGRLPEKLNTRQAAIMMRSYISGLMENWLFTPAGFDLENDAEPLVDAFMDMLRFSPVLLK